MAGEGGGRKVATEKRLTYMMKQTMLQVGSEMTRLDWAQERPVAGPTQTWAGTALAAVCGRR